MSERTGARERAHGASMPSGHGVAIVGMACVFPMAPTLEAYWSNIMAGVDSVRPGADVSTDDHHPMGGTKDPEALPVSGAFLPSDIPLDHVLPDSLPAGAGPGHLLALEVALAALRNGGIDPSSFRGDRTRLFLAEPVPSDGSAGQITPWVAKALGLMGADVGVSGGGASSLLAVGAAAHGLLSGSSDLALAGGIRLFSRLQDAAADAAGEYAIAPGGPVRPFDRDAQGTAPGEGVGIVVLERLADARAHNRRIYALVVSAGTATEAELGRGAQRGEVAVGRAYEAAGLDPESVSLVEANGVGDAAADATEAEGLRRVFGNRGTAPVPRCAVGSVKSMIGHGMEAAGIAGLIKAALALYHRQLPPSLHCLHPIDDLSREDTPFYVNTRGRPWIHGGDRHPRRAGVSAFDRAVAAHLVLEEDDADENDLAVVSTQWPSEVCVIGADSPAELALAAENAAAALTPFSGADLKNISYTLNTRLQRRRLHLAVVASSVADLLEKLSFASEQIGGDPDAEIRDARGIYYAPQPLAAVGSLALLFPGEGAQYAGMLADLCMHLPTVRRIFDYVDSLRRVDWLFPPPWPDAERWADEQVRSRISVAAESLIIANSSLLLLFRQLGVEPDTAVGHSTGDYVACIAAGILSREDALSDRFSTLWEALDSAPDVLAEGGLLAVGIDGAGALEKLGELAPEIAVAMDNCPHQAVLAGSVRAIERARERLTEAGIIAERLPINHQYHTESFAPLAGPLQQIISDIPIHLPIMPIYSCTTADRFPNDLDAIRELGFEHWRRPVRFRETIQRMYDDGARVFLELGPRGTLTAFVDDILKGRPHVAIASDRPHRNGLTQLLHAVATLCVHGVAVDLQELYTRRSPSVLDLTAGAERPRSAATLALRQMPSLDSEPSTPEPEAPVAARSDAPAIVDAPLPAQPQPRPPERTREQEPVATISEILRLPEVPSISAEAMSAYFRTMEQFLDVQRTVMEAYLGSGTAAVPAADGASAIEVETGLAPSVDSVPIDVRQAASDVGPEEDGAVELPFVERILSLVPGQELQTERQLTLEDDLFLRDHTFGRQAATDPGLLPTAVVPMTVSLEIMAEAASALLPGMQVIGLQQVRCWRWIAVADRPTTIVVTARAVAGAGSERQVSVSIRSADPRSGAEPAVGGPAAEARVILSETYPAPDDVSPFTPRQAHPCPVTLDRLYSYLFHGPVFRRAETLDVSGDDGTCGTISVPSLRGFFRNRPADGLILDPILLDGATHMIAAWQLEHVPGCEVMFPIAVDEIRVFGPRLEPPAVVRSDAHVVDVDDRRIQADVYLYGPDGRPHVVLRGWQGVRIPIAQERIDASRNPRSILTAEIWEAPAAALPAGGGYVTTLIDGRVETAPNSLTEIVAYGHLSRAEREQWWTMTAVPQRRTEWIMGRVVAKDAVREHVRRQTGVEIYPGDVELGTDARGQLRVAAFLGPERIDMPPVSLTHTGAVVAAIAGGQRDSRLGIDVEEIRDRPDGFDTMVFEEEELSLLEELTGEARGEWITRFWCAKESIGKAVGEGLSDGPGSAIVIAADLDSGKVTVRLSDALAAAAPDLAPGPVLVHTGYDDGLVFAVTAGERAGGT